MDLIIQPQGAESPNPSSEIIGQNPPKRANCDTCLSILGRFDKHDRYTPSYRVEDIVAGGENCRACAAISEFLAGFGPMDYYHDVDLFGGPISVPVSLDCDWDFSGADFGYEETPKVSISNRGQTFEFFTASIGSNYEQQKRFDEPAPFPDHHMIWYMRAPSGDTSSAQAFDTLRRWISRCEEEHTLCWIASDKLLPHRLLKIDGIRPLRVRLVEDYRLRGNYACLSHRWGPQTESNSLKTHNLNLYKSKIPEENLYPLMKDAIEAVFRLDLRFIWIDCYCIMQDDVKDWERAAAQMASIYENAFLTISATSSEGGNSIFSTIGQPYAGIQVTEIEGEPVYLRQRLRHPIHVLPPYKGHANEFLDGPSLERGWVFQERLLSNRFIHFTQEEIFWECRESTWCECTSRGLEFKGWRKEVPRTLQNEDWAATCEVYSKTKLTLRKDRLPALAGIARRYAELHGLTYLAGIWKEHLPWALMWHVFTPEDNRPPPKPLEHIAPSWSWLSMPLTIDFDTYSQPGCPGYRFLGCNIQPPDADIYAGSHRLEIMVEAPVLDLKIYKEAGDRHVVGRSGNIFLRIEQDFDFDPEEPTKYRSVPKGSSCLLLIIYSHIGIQQTIQGILLFKIDSIEGDSMKYERIGYWEMANCSLYVDDSNEFADYCGGSCPELRQKLKDSTGLDDRLWELVGRTAIREVTII